jgi:hypothetical protein
MRRSAIVVTGLVVLCLDASATIQAQATCAATPEDAWRLAREAVATGDAGLVMLRLTPEYRARDAVELAIGASMVAQIGGLSGELSNAPAKAAAAKAAEAQLLAELDGILRKYKAPTIAEIGTPLLVKLDDPAVQQQFASIDHVGYAREMETFFAKVEKAATAAGVKGDPSKLDELVVGGGDLQAPLGKMNLAGDTATASAGRVTMKFVRTGGCWMIDRPQ